MIDKKNAPVEWAGLMYELDDAHEHLAALISDMNTVEDFDEVGFRIQLGHVFSHLNRAWNCRNKTSGLNEYEWLDASRFPSDLDPV